MTLRESEISIFKFCEFFLYIFLLDSKLKSYNKMLIIIIFILKPT